MKAPSPGVLARHSRELAALLGMGYGLVEALARVAERADAPFRALARNLEAEVRRGQTLGEALAVAGPALPQIFVRAVQVGEAAGDLPGALRAVADLLERAEWRRLGVWMALAYPRLVLTFGLLVGLLLLGLGGGIYGELLRGMSVQLPPSTRAALWLSDQARNGPFLLAVLLALGGLQVVVGGSLGTDSLRLRIPVLGTWIRRQESVVCLDWLEYLLAHRVPLDEALRLSAGACASPAFRAGLQSLAEEVSRGGTLAGHEVFPATASWLVARAEALEFPPGFLGRVARTLQRDVDLSSRRGLAVLEPLALIGLGALLAFLVFAFFLPLYQLVGVMG